MEGISDNGCVCWVVETGCHFVQRKNGNTRVFDTHVIVLKILRSGLVGLVSDRIACFRGGQSSVYTDVSSIVLHVVVISGRFHAAGR